MNFPTSKKSILAMAYMVGALTCPPAGAASLPLWELGAGLAGLRLPDYRGADQMTNYVVPAPYVVYRGDVVKADRNGLRGTLFNNDAVELSLSLNGTLPVSSNHNVARRGMAGLKPTVEVGGNLSATLWNSAADHLKLDLRLPLRTAITVSAAPKQIGWIFAPNLNLDVRDPAGFAGWKLGLLAGPLFSSGKYNAYFYSVNPADASASRPAYSAPGGYAGSQFTTALSKRFDRYWVGGFLRYDTLAGAVFQNSPLVRQRSTVSAGVAVTWVFGQSSARVNADD